MSKIQKILVTFGVFWLSLWVATMLGWPISKLNNGMTYTDSFLSALALGVLIDLHRTLAAILAGVLVTAVIANRKSELWSIIIAVLYLVDAPRNHWKVPLTSWDRLWQTVALLLPAACCIVAAFVTARLQRKKSNSRDGQPSAPVMRSTMRETGPPRRTRGQA